MGKPLFTQLLIISIRQGDNIQTISPRNRHLAYSYDVRYNIGSNYQKVLSVNTRRRHHFIWMKEMKKRSKTRFCFWSSKPDLNITENSS